jgi:hypothetical protein
MKNNKEYLDKVVKILEKPYFKELGYYGITGKVEIKYVLCGIYKREVSFFNKSIYENGNIKLYYETDYSSYWENYDYDVNGNQTYFESSRGYWRKIIYDQDNYLISYMDNLDKCI